MDRISQVWGYHLHLRQKLKSETAANKLAGVMAGAVDRHSILGL